MAIIVLRIVPKWVKGEHQIEFPHVQVAIPILIWNEETQNSLGLPGPLASGPHLRFGGPVANNLTKWP